MTKTQNYTLGLDMGTNFIGWTVVVHDDNLRPSGLVSRDTHIFQKAVDAKSRIPKIRHTVLHAGLWQDERWGVSLSSHRFPFLVIGCIVLNQIVQCHLL